MVNNKTIQIELKQPPMLKGCYGTDEWSPNSGICFRCKLKEGCGKINLRRLED